MLHSRLSKSRVVAIGTCLDLALLFGLKAAGLDLGTAQMISLLLSMGILWRPMRRLSLAVDPTGSVSPLGMLIVGLLALFLRGGVLAWIDMAPAMTFIPLATLAVAGTHFIIAVSIQSGSIKPGSSFQHGKAHDGPPLTRALVIYAVLLRAVYMGLPELMHEEAYYWNYAQHLALGYLDHPPLVGWVIWLFTRLLGHTELAVRLGAFCFWLLGATFVYRLTREIFDIPTAAAAVLLWAVLPVYFLFGLAMLPDAGLSACWAGALYFFYQALIREKSTAWLGAGLFIGIGMLSKYTIVLLGGAVVAFVVFDPPSRRWLKHPAPYLGAVLAVLLFSPVIIWNAQNEWASFAFQGVGRVAGKFDFDLPDLVGSILILLTPIGVTALMATMLRRGAILDPTDSADAWAQRRTHRLLVLLTLLPLAVFVGFSLFRNTKLNWTGPLWLGVLPYIAHLMTKPVPASAGRLVTWAQRPWKATVLVLLIIYGAGLHYLVLGLLGLPYPQNQLGLGWPKLAEHMENVARQVQTETGHKPMLAGIDIDRMSSWLAFYRSRVMRDAEGRNTGAGAYETSGEHLIGKESHMYRFWFPPASQEGRPLVLMASEAMHLHQAFIGPFFDRLGPIKTVVSSKNGKQTGTYYYRVGYAYKPSGLQAASTDHRASIPQTAPG